LTAYTGHAAYNLVVAGIGIAALIALLALADFFMGMF